MPVTQTWSHPWCRKMSHSPAEAFASHIRCQKNIQASMVMLKTCSKTHFPLFSCWQLYLIFLTHCTQRNCTTINQNLLSSLCVYFPYALTAAQEEVCANVKEWTWEEAEVWGPTLPLMLNWYLEVNEAVRKRWAELLWVHTQTHTDTGNVSAGPQRPPL